MSRASIPFPHALAIEQLKRHEGFRGIPYEDTTGHLTVGYGHNLKQPITREASELILEQDIDLAMVDLDVHKLWWRTLPEEAQLVVLNLNFNMGWPTFRTFTRFWAAMDQERFDLAAAELRDSRWWTQVGHTARGRDLVGMLERLASDRTKALQRDASPTDPVALLRSTIP